MTQLFNKTRGKVVPEYTTTERDARSDWQLGDMITNTTDAVNQYYDGISAWVDLGADGTGAFESDSGVVKEVSTAYTDDFVFGSPTLDTTTPAHQSRFFFDKGKSSFRAGVTSSPDNWSSSNIGDYSFATGWNTKAYGTGSTAQGVGTTALQARIGLP